MAEREYRILKSKCQSCQIVEKDSYLENGHLAAKPEYSLWGWFSLGFGISATPKRVVFECQKCRHGLASDNRLTTIREYFP